MAELTKKQIRDKKQKRQYITIAVILLIYMVSLPIIQFLFLEGIKVGDGITIHLSGDEWDADQYIEKGIDVNEGVFTWTNGNELKFKLLRCDGGEYTLSLDILDAVKAPQEVNVVINNNTPITSTISGKGIYSIPLHMEWGRNNITIKLPGAISPKSLGMSDDERVLALQLTKIELVKE